MDRRVFVCSVCGEERYYKKALKRHVRYHQHDGDDRAVDNVVYIGEKLAQEVNDIVPLCNSRETTEAVLGERCINPPTRLTSSNEEPTRRKEIDSLVAHLKLLHLRDRTYLSQSTENIIDQLRPKFGKELTTETLTGIVVSAKHFAGTQSPRRPAVEKRSVKFVGSAKRKLFADNEVSTSEIAVNESTTIADKAWANNISHEIGELLSKMTEKVCTVVDELSIASAVNDPLSVEVVVPVAESLTEMLMTKDLVGTVVDENSEDEQWRNDLWRSFVTKENEPPSPMGYQWSPSIALSKFSPPPLMSPVATWSSSRDDEPWGPDSPQEPLEFDR